MIFFGHIGATTYLIKKYELLNNDNFNYIDYRVLTIGAVLPDIIDKALYYFLIKGSLPSSRLFGHTLLFCSTLLIIGTYYRYKYNNNTLLTLGLCSFIHVFLDFMWLYPATFFWPAYGINNLGVLNQSSQSIMLKVITSFPFLLFEEALGIAILLYSYSKPNIKKGINNFIK